MQMSLRKLWVNGLVPEERQGHIAISVPSRNLATENEKLVFVFGGRGTNKKATDVKRKGRKYLNDCWLQHLTEQDDLLQACWWEQIHVNGESPAPRWCSSGFFYNGKIYILGGRGEDFFADMWEFDLQSLSWTAVKMDGECPPPLNGHSANLIGDHLFVFGGSSSFGRERKYNGDMFVCDLRSMKWTKLEKHQNLETKDTCNAPCARYWHSTTFDGKNIYLVGGFAFDENGKEVYFNDVWKFDPVQMTWEQIIFNNNSFSPRNRAGLCSLGFGGILLLHDGNEFDYNVRRDVFLDDFVLIDCHNHEQKEQKPCREGEEEEGKSFPVGHHSFLFIPKSKSSRSSSKDGATEKRIGSVVIFGGENGSQRFNDTILVDLVQLNPQQP